MKLIKQKIESFLLQYQHLGYKETTYAELYGKAPYIAPQAWLHAVFKPLYADEIAYVKDNLKNLPDFYEKFLKIYNGFSIYNSALSLYGLRRNYKRDFDSVWQPYDIFDLNIYDKPGDASGNEFFFAAYNKDGSLVYYNSVADKIIKCSADSVAELNTWNSFEDFIIDEIDRLSGEF